MIGHHGHQNAMTKFLKVMTSLTYYKIALLYKNSKQFSELSAHVSNDWNLIYEGYARIFRQNHVINSYFKDCK